MEDTVLRQGSRSRSETKLDFDKIQVPITLRYLSQSVITLDMIGVSRLESSFLYTKDIDILLSQEVMTY
jgi:hypothetical protein